MFTYNGTNWSQATNVDATGLFSVSCPTANFCVAVGGSGEAVTYSGTTWSQPVKIDRETTRLLSVSCPSATFCAAIDENGNALTGDT